MLTYSASQTLTVQVMPASVAGSQYRTHKERHLPLVVQEQPRARQQQSFLVHQNHQSLGTDGLLPQAQHRWPPQHAVPQGYLPVYQGAIFPRPCVLLDAADSLNGFHQPSFLPWGLENPLPLPYPS
jgi:hypothetical protein